MSRSEAAVQGSNASERQRATWPRDEAQTWRDLGVGGGRGGAEREGSKWLKRKGREEGCGVLPQ